MNKIQIILPYWLLLSLSLIYSSCKYANKESRFVSDKWINIEDKHKRESMLKDLCDNYIKVGLSRDSVTKLIGLPDVVLDSGKRTPYGVFWHPYYLDNEKKSGIQDSLLYLFYTEVESTDLIKIDRYTVGFNGSGPNYILVVYNNRNKLIDYSFERTEF